MPLSVPVSPDSILLQRLQEAVQPVGGAATHSASATLVHAVAQPPVAALLHAVSQPTAAVQEPVAALVEGSSSTVIGLAVGLSLTSVVIIGFVGFGYLLYRVSG